MFALVFDRLQSDVRLEKIGSYPTLVELAGLIANKNQPALHASRNSVGVHVVIAPFQGTLLDPKWGDNATSTLHVGLRKSNQWFMLLREGNRDSCS